MTSIGVGRHPVRCPDRNDRCVGGVRLHRRQHLQPDARLRRRDPVQPADGLRHPAASSASVPAGSSGAAMEEKAAIHGALRLYLDFINLFISLLRIFRQLALRLGRTLALDPRAYARTQPQAYIASISSAYFAAIGLRFSFIVGVSSSPPGSQSPLDDRELLDLLDARQLGVGLVDALLDRLRAPRSSRPAPRARCPRSRAARPTRARSRRRARSARCCRSAGRRCSRPGRSAGWRVLIVASMFAGDMFLPAALMISSFLRSTIFR